MHLEEKNCIGLGLRIRRGIFHGDVIERTSQVFSEDGGLAYLAGAGNQHDFTLPEQFVDGPFDFSDYIHNASHLPMGGIISSDDDMVKFGNSIPRFI